ncbi:hypothetical protein EYZ11_012832 [Aspergillus tanneri]|uniref:Uncharacterized protein n=1 Tax=Aspergillus tanneri TaxID=1220188 RepID=A0A4S3IZR1_9EURO|nr:hypothetical protein EYZ11_012832 [Aspergillus tanneri]
MGFTPETGKAIEKAFVEGPKAFVVDGKFGNGARLSQKIEPINAIQAYVTAGTTYPAEDKEFEKKLAKSAYDLIHKPKPGLYDDTKAALTSVSKSCAKFKKSSLDELVSYPTIIIGYCNNAIDAIEGKRTGLKEQLDILGDEKYEAEGSEKDKEFQRAKKLAEYDLDKMIKEAKANSAKATAIKTKLTDFKSETDTNKGLVKALNSTYSGKVMWEGKSYNSVLEFMDGELGELEAKVTKKKDDQEKAEKEFKENMDPKKWKFWSNALTVLSGPAGALQYSADIIKEGKEWVKLLKEWEDSKSAKAKVASCRCSIAALDSHLPILVQKMDDAIKGMGMLGKTFDDQVLELGHVKDKLTETNENIGREGILRGILIRGGVEEAAIKYKEIKKLADKFHTDVPPLAI